MRHTIALALPCAAAAAAALALPHAARAQEAMYTEAATMPSPGVFLLRNQYHYSVYGSSPVDGSTATETHEFLTTLQFGVANDLAVRVDVPVALETEEFPTGDDYDKGVEDIDLMLKWRFLRNDTGGVDTIRAALLAGAGVASGDDSDFSSQSVNPLLGAVFTKVWGRLGVNQDIIYRWNTGGERDANLGGEGPDDAFMHNSALVYRIIPDQYTSETTGAWYLTAELNGLYETNGDYELRWAPGLMYEGRRFGFEIMAQLPLWHDLDERPELDFRVGIGFRFLF
ncbi:MAG: hypothetical protein SFZ24_03785 [Planctomycetota bacterium]|nr:hypothetical protein [Planctomycetota bacterium]